MKKKVKDLTVTQIYKYCTSRELCDACPFEHFCFCIAPYMLEEETLEQEVDIPEEEEK